MAHIPTSLVIQEMAMKTYWDAIASQQKQPKPRQAHEQPFVKENE